MKLKILSSSFIVFGLINAQSYSLEECISIALQNKESLKASALNVESARLGTKESLSGILPSINYSGGWSQSEYKLYDYTTGKLSDMVTTTNWETGFSVSQTIYDGGIWWNNINSAKNDYRIAAQFQRQVLTNIIKGVHSSFFNYLKSQQLLEVAQLNRRSSARQMELVKRQYELGAVNKTDLLKAEVSLGQAEIDVISQESELKNSFRELKNSMGLMGSEVDFEVADSGRPLELVPDYTLALETMDNQNPSLKAKRYQVLGAQLNHKLIKGQRFPSLRASYSYGASADSLGGLTDNWKDNTRSRTGLTLSFPLF
ncbi:MAG: TolC family protein, partial [Candidatus Neomarinimicrobiota bacterium]